MADTRIDGFDVLLVEDDAGLREAISDTLELAGARVIGAADGREALRLLADITPGVIVTDVNMPHIDGHELLRRVRELKPHVPVLLITAFGTIDRSVQAMREGAARQYPLGGVQTADQVAEVMAWLLGAGAARLTGQVIAVDGGFTTVRPLVK